ncbi:hypothetical protein DFQ27_004484 [Actinomortierella ambigua]|uniref:Uncharacterized protein n=1 Tax=Actinomortierella ambigua TaxID=1343610 RepID=A0A9P6U424_9FUNG|nr:hypothetical protein DFQ27_004484 [Actinomortierella ambigua]
MTSRLPPECIGLILDHLEFTDDEFTPSALCQVLTLNREFFYLGLERLYRDPLRTIAACHRDALQGFLQLVAVVSPSQHPVLERIRDLSSGDFPSSATVDYLSFVDVMRYRDVVKKTYNRLLSWIGRPHHQQDDTTIQEFWEVLVDVVCGHRLSKIRFLSISSERLQHYHKQDHLLTSIEQIEVLFDNISTHHLQHYHRQAHQLTSIGQIEILFDDFSPSYTLEDVQREYLQDAGKLASRLQHKDAVQHGQGSQRISSPLSLQGRPKPLDIHLLALCPHWNWRPFRPGVQMLMSILPKAVTPIVSTIDDKSNWLRFCLAPESFDLSAVRAIRQCDLNTTFPRLEPGDDFSVASDSVMRVVQQCRSLNALSLIVDDRTGFAFSWAPWEKDGIYVNIPRITIERHPHGLPPIPLKHLEVGFEDILRPTTDHVLDHAMEAFGSTLQSIVIYSSRSLKTYLFHDMPELRRLVMKGLDPQAPRVTTTIRFPKLEEMTLHDKDYRPWDDSVGPWDLPALRSLSLRGDIVWKFHNESWTSLHNTLEKLHLDTEQTINRRDNVPLVFSWGGRSPMPFPRLRELTLTGAPMLNFRLSMLCECPLIESVTLAPPWSEESPNFEEGFVGDAALLLQSPLPLIKLCLKRTWYISDEFLLNTLPRICPNLAGWDIFSGGVVTPEYIDSDEDDYESIGES